MSRSRSFCFALAIMVLMGLTPLRVQSVAAVNSTSISTDTGRPATNKFVGRWSSHFITSSGQVIDDGVLDISDSTDPDANEVSVVHSVRGGPVIGHTMGYPDRIEIQISLGDGRVAHYNGVLVSATKIEGRFFITGNPQNHHARKFASIPVAEEIWAATATA